MDYLRQIAGGVRNASSYLSQNMGKAVSYLRQVPQVGAFLDDMAPAAGAARKLYNAAKKRSISELPGLDEVSSGIQAVQNARTKFKKGAYRLPG